MLGQKDKLSLCKFLRYIVGASFCARALAGANATSCMCAVGKTKQQVTAGWQDKTKSP